MRGTLSVFIAALAAAPLAPAQSLNVNFAPPVVVGPSSQHAAAGLAGAWNIIEGANTVTYFNLRRLDGAPTPARVKNIGGTELVNTNHAGTIRDDQDLLDHYLITFNPNLEVCLFFEGLQDGTYEVITYAWLPDQPAVDSYVTVDYSGDPAAWVGGPWTGGHQSGVTFAVHQVEVSGGSLYGHSGIPPGSGFASAALNGVQLRRINPTTPQDIDGDEDVDLADYRGYRDCHAGPGEMGWRPHCPAFDADADDDVDLRDFAEFQRRFGDDA